MTTTAPIVEHPTLTTKTTELSNGLSIWLTQQFRIHKARLTTIHLRQMVKRGGADREAPVAVYSILDGPDRPTAEEQAQAIWHDARVDADDVAGLCKYVVVLETAEAQVLGRKVIRVAPTELTADVGPEEEATPAGFAHQMMRHVEIGEMSKYRQFDLLFRQYDRATMALERSNERLLKENERLAQLISERDEAHFKNLQLLEQLSQHSHERELQMKRDARTAELQFKAIERFEPLIPAVLNKMVGKELIPTDKHDAIDSFILSMSPEQGAQLRTVLTDAQIATVGMLYREAHERFKKREAEAAAKKEAEAKKNEAEPASTTKERRNGASP
jgi:hypothetical protein